jgi:hypothetical protein
VHGLGVRLRRLRHAGHDDPHQDRARDDTQVRATFLKSSYFIKIICCKIKFGGLKRQKKTHLLYVLMMT